MYVSHGEGLIMANDKMMLGLKDVEAKKEELRKANEAMTNEAQEKG
jgi:hypothetical protein